MTSAPSVLTRLDPLRFLRANAAEVGAFVVASALFTVAVVRSPGFAAPANINGLLITATIIGFAALGQTLVVISGGIDLSVPWLVAAGALGITLLAPRGPGDTAAVVGGLLLAGALIGALTGLGVTLLDIPPIIMSLGVGGVVQGMLLTAQSLSSAGSLQTPQPLIDVVNATVGPVPAMTILLVLCGAAVSLLLRRAPLGRSLLATGRNDRVARYAGLDVRLVRTVTYSISGVSSVTAGLLAAGYIEQAYVAIGTPYLFTSIAAVAIGGVSLAGGRGSFWGVLAGALVLTLLQAVLPMFDLSLAQLQIVYGLVIIFGIGLARIVVRITREEPE